MVWRPYMTQNMVQPVYFRQYIHGKTDENHVLFSKYIINKICYQLFIFNLKPWSYEMEAVCYWK